MLLDNMLKKVDVAAICCSQDEILAHLRPNLKLSRGHTAAVGMLWLLFPQECQLTVV
jgi:hypothetical protein